MATLARRRPSAVADIWPGFVDALAALLMVIIFLLTVFVLAQFFLTDQLAGRDQALRRLETQVAELADVLALERQAGAELRKSIADLSAQLQASTAARDRLSGEVTTLRGNLETSVAELERLRERAGELEADLTAERGRLAKAQEKLGKSESALTDEQRLSAARKSEVDRLSQNILALRAELQRLNAALEASEEKSKAQNVQITNLSKRLNAALASKVEELARYRSEFFGRLREVLGSRKDIRIVGDRFVFQSEVLFGSGDARLNEPGRAQISRLATTLLDLSKKIPPGIDWVLRVDGHTDVRPIATKEFPSNWELSTARALSVVRQLVAEGVPPNRLAATGFGSYQPLDTGNTDAAFTRNRRIEFKLTER
ncbi:MAG: peptidoglycan -binding protein [Alphaproteobacteria bacterium]